MTDKRLKELRALADAAQPGPWTVEWQSWSEAPRDADEKIEDIVDANGDFVVRADSGHYPPRGATARLIAESRTAIPELLDEVEKLRAQVADLRGDFHVIRRLLDYDLSDLPPGDEHRTCDSRLYQANMRAFKACCEMLSRPEP